MSLTQLQTFTRLASLGNFARTAQELGITPTAVALQVQALSKHFGVPLIEVVRRRPALTAAGRVLAQHAPAVLIAAADVEDRMRQFASTLADRLVLGATATISDYVAAPLLAAYKAEWPEVTIDVQMANPKTLADYLRTGTVMLALADVLPSPADFDVVPFAEDRIVLIVPETGHRFSKRRTIRSADLSGETLVGREASAPSRILTERELAKRGVRLQIGLVVPSWESVTRAVAARLGMAFVSSLVVADPKLHPGIHVVEVADLELRRRLCVFTLRNATLSTRTRQFIEFVRGFARRSASPTRRRRARRPGARARILASPR